MFIFPKLPLEINYEIENFVAWNCLENLKPKYNIVLQQLLENTIFIDKLINQKMEDYRETCDIFKEIALQENNQKEYLFYKWFTMDFDRRELNRENEKWKICKPKYLFFWTLRTEKI